MFVPRGVHQTENKDCAIVAHVRLQGVAKGGTWDPEALVLAVGPAEAPSGGAAGPVLLPPLAFPRERLSALTRRRYASKSGGSDTVPAALHQPCRTAPRHL